MNYLPHFLHVENSLIFYLTSLVSSRQSVRHGRQSSGCHAVLRTSCYAGDQQARIRTREWRLKLAYASSPIRLERVVLPNSLINNCCTVALAGRYLAMDSGHLATPTV